MKCISCGGERWATVSRDGAIETWRCLDCNHEEVVHVNPSLSAAVLLANRAPVFRLMGTWSTKPDRNDVELLRTLFPRLKNITLATMMRAAREKEQFELGRFTDAELSVIEEALEALNITFTRVPI